MANIMSLKSLRNKPSRNGFDLSYKFNFTAKVGELLPVMCKEVLPGDVFEIDLKTFSRTQPINTAAFARMREYYDFFFVPYELLWNRSNTLLTQMLDNPQHAVAFDPTSKFTLRGEMPYVTTNQLISYLQELKPGAGSPINPDKVTNYFGYRRDYASAKLFEYLGYGNFYPAIERNPDASIKPFVNQDMNIFGFLAYQKIYFDHFRDSQWEKISPSCFNVDYMNGTESMNISLGPARNYLNFYENYNMFDLRYCNWQKDLFHGVLPRQQYGDVSSVSVFPSTGSLPFTQLSGRGNFANSELDVSDGSITFDTSSDNDLGSFSILALRQAEFLQKWKEIVQTANKDYKDQIQKIWGTSVSGVSEMSTYLGGISSSLDINEVVNTNITGDNGADIAGKGVGVSNGRIRFQSNGQFGLIMCIYHAMPLLDYTTDLVNPAFTRVNVQDYANPVFDKVGMELVPLSSMLNPIIAEQNDPLNNLSPGYLGYAPRYIDYKTSVDYSVGGFKRSLSSWVIGYGNQSVIEQLGSVSGATLPDSPVEDINYTLFKVNPNSVDPIFGVNADDTLETDQFLCSTFFDIKAVRNLDVDGLPY